YVKNIIKNSESRLKELDKFEKKLNKITLSTTTKNKSVDIINNEVNNNNNKNDIESLIKNSNEYGNFTGLDTENNKKSETFDQKSERFTVNEESNNENESIFDNIVKFTTDPISGEPSSLGHET